MSTHYKHFLANFGYVWACISITDHNRPVKVCISITDHNNTSESYYILYFNINYTTIPYKMCNLILACSSPFEWSNVYRVWVIGVQTLLVAWAAIKMIKKYRTLKNQQWRYVFVFGMSSNPCERLSWQWSYGSWIYNYLCNQCLSPLMLWVRISIRARCTTLCDKVCQWLATGRWFSPGPLDSSTNKTDHHDITEILLKVALNTFKQTNKQTNKNNVQV